MYNLLNIYDCPNCGKRLSDEVEYINVQLAEDEWGKMPFCNKCNAEAKIRMHIDPETKQEIYHYEEVDDERARWAHGFYNETSEDEDDSYEYRCENCGGVITEDSSSCWCDSEPEENAHHVKATKDFDDDLPF